MQVAVGTAAADLRLVEFWTVGAWTYTIACSLREDIVCDKSSLTRKSTSLWIALWGIKAEETTVVGTSGIVGEGSFFFGASELKECWSHFTLVYLEELEF